MERKIIMTKRLLALFLSGAMLLSCAACGNDNAQGGTSEDTQSSNTESTNSGSNVITEGISLALLDWRLNQLIYLW